MHACTCVYMHIFTELKRTLHNADSSVNLLSGPEN